MGLGESIYKPLLDVERTADQRRRRDDGNSNAATRSRAVGLGDIY